MVINQMVPPLFADSKNPSNKAQRSAALAAIAASAFVLLVVSGTWSTEIMSGHEGGGGGRGGAAELESVSAKAGALARVSGVQMVKDVKKVLQDVEATLQARVNSLSHHSFQQYGTPLLCLCLPPLGLHPRLSHPWASLMSAFANCPSSHLKTCPVDRGMPFQCEIHRN